MSERREHKGSHRASGALLSMVGVSLCLGLLPADAADLTPQQIYEGAAPAVVAVVGQSSDGGSRGTGSIISTDGLVVTNAHVVINEKTGQPFEKLFVFLKPPRVTGNFKNDLSRGHKAVLVAADPELDLALLRFEVGQETVSIMNFGNPEKVRIGDRMAAIGHPEQGGLWTLTTGVMSAEFEDFNNIKGKHVFQTETGLNRGNSGGPLLDGHGHLVGVNTAIARLAKDGLPITSISFAIKSGVARAWLTQHGVRLEYATGAPESIESMSAGPKAETQAPVETRKPTAPPAVKQEPPTPPAQGGPEVHTEAHPYDEDALFAHVRRLEGEMEDLAEEMRQKIRRR